MTRVTSATTQSLRQVFAIPIAVAAASVLGLVSALMGDGGWDALSWLALGSAVALAARYGLPRRQRRE